METGICRREKSVYIHSTTHNTSHNNVNRCQNLVKWITNYNSKIKKKKGLPAYQTEREEGWKRGFDIK